MKLVFPVLFLLLALPSLAQRPFRLLQRDTAVSSGENIQLSIDSTRLYSNFVFCAQAPATGRWTIWHRNNDLGKYEPVFNDRFDRMNVVVSGDKRYMLYVRYKPQRPGGMYYSQLDSAWVCVSDINGNNESVVFLVPEFNKNAVYDLDWSFDRRHILYSYGNDQYPSLTRDGDVFEYDIVTNKLSNLTNDWQLWSKNCRYAPGTYDFAYSHFANFWEALPTDIFLQRAGQPRQQLTNSNNQVKGYKYCTLTDFDGEYILFRRGLYFDNKLYRKKWNTEELLCSIPGYGGIIIGNDLYAATDFYNNIYIFTSKATIGNIKVSGIKTFAKDHTYNYALDCNTRLNWMGRQPAKIRWSTGDTATSIVVKALKTTTYYCRVAMNGVEYMDSITITVSGPRPEITRNCLTLSTGHYQSYQWLVDNHPIAGATDSSYTPEAAGNYAVMVTSKKGRKGTSDYLSVNMGATDSIKKQNELVNIIADPAANTLTIKAPFALNMIMVDEKGKIVDRQDNVSLVNLDRLPDGVYDMMLYNNNCVRLRTRRIVKRG